jgi:multiple sugar transport system substrate-binding protein
MKRIFIAIFSIAILFSAFSSTTHAQDVVTLRFWAASAPEPLENAVAAWNAENPNIQVELIRYSNNPEGNARLDTALLAPNEVDVFVSYGLPAFRRRVDSGLLANLSELAPDFDVQAEFATEGTIIDGVTYGAPAQAQPYFIYVNLDAAAEKGVEIPEQWTWETFTEVASALTDGTGPFDTRAIMLPNWPYVNELAVYELGDNAYFPADNACETNFNDPIWQQVLSLRHNLEQEAKVALPYADITAAQLSLQDAYLNGDVNMMLGGTWLLASVTNLETYPHDFVTGFAPIPAIDADGFNFRPGGLEDYTGVSSNSAHPEEAAAFFQWFVTEGYVHLVRSGRFSAWTEFTAEQQTEEFFGAIGENAASLLDRASFERVVLGSDAPFAQIKRSAGVPQLNQLFNEVSVRVFNGELTAEDGASLLKQQGDEIMSTVCS